MGIMIVVISGIVLCEMLFMNMSFARNEADGIERERTMTVRECSLNAKGERTIHLWAAKAVFLPWSHVKTVYVKVPCAEVYEQVRLYGEQKVRARYVKRRKLFTVTDSYTGIRLLDDIYGNGGRGDETDRAVSLRG